MKTGNPFMLKECARATTAVMHTISNLMWYEYTQGVPVSYLLAMYDVSLEVTVRKGVNLRIGDNLVNIKPTSYNDVVRDTVQHIIQYMTDKLSKVGTVDTSCTTNIEKFVKANSNLIMYWYIDSVENAN